jgi:hypothetical protein
MDDLPALSVDPNVNVSDIHPMPMFSPYHRFSFSDGFNVVPPPEGQFVPSSGKLMLQFVPPSLSSAPTTGESTETATIGIGAQESLSCFTFNFYGSNLGCESQGPDCVFTFTGQRPDHLAKKDDAVASQTVNVPACSQKNGCQLYPVSVTGFEGLASVSIAAKVGDEDRTWWTDDIELGWYDTSCQMAVCRSQVRDTILAKSQGKRWEA